ncbi:MAG: bifunctional [glutamate--ammonia ligase]-adenylyl-L-tyrosine phosphorylase/[glutamate--ammonia-ligase] adenylyltransferase [Propionivibrio sp.]|uniref:bifunctional [glutamate--ammonia ligase]-adenylyl-L-tyrosine phosphorylase/[glutamate--ammonia-ligase] adenylyltransferase n=1 Tax=Propionivibrio sp. TaxID=2212460 RepID=UPI001A44C55B|nr:bifunctional [glutamate--ammonia ligase]-adenylyl-L-tyrosine phosphorylase/[glutamate--ammonia-ligase] adenylyltransferase [Propionivibrio sp.]MBL8416360.1 bifunctional [glutamate--ammonia ligase]-adenylyl-L-tyrosine phosphorylase/[glutamate--ammonia-ligase] adenylyltransferase [Propionivibrio sp.]
MSEKPNNPLPSAWQPALTHSRYLRQLLEARPEIVTWLHEHAARPLDGELMREFLQTAAPLDEAGLKRVLRQLRQRIMAALMVRDIGGQAALAEVVESMTQLADVSTNFALDFVHRRLVAQFGEPLDSQGQPQRLLVIGMGKLGGRELNVSSDVDYIFIYPEEGETAGSPDGSHRIDAYDFFVRLGKRLIAVLGEITGDGQVFRVDMRLRPNGDSGPLVCSLVSLENYFITQGREWERYAWIKARVMNEGDNLQTQWRSALEQIARSFIFRKYLDFGAINAMRDLHAQIRREVVRKDMADHIKLGPGGIREIEFMAQVFQLIRGGRDPALQLRPTLKVLPLLVARRLLPADSERELVEAYEFLRRLEHRLQYVNDAQTHMLPTRDDERQAIAVAMGFTDWPALLAALDAHRQRVSRHFEAIFSDPDQGTHRLAGLWYEQSEGDDALEILSELGFRKPQAMLEQLGSFRRSAKYLQLPAQNRERLDTLGPRLIEAAAATKMPDATWQRGLDFLATISRRGAYLALLQQNPQTLSKVAEIIGSSGWAADFLTQHPILLDEVLDPRLYEIATDWASFCAELNRHLAEHAGDTEREMDILREAHHAQVFRLLAQDIAGLQSVERLADHLTELADIVVITTLDLCWSKLKNRHPHPERAPKFAVIAYGKLGGKELGYGSDLDLVYLHNDPEPDIGELYARLGQRMSTWMSSRTSAGMLFDTDFRLRPNGEAGMLVSSFDAFRDYQMKDAWTWEHQALTRARFCAGERELGARFEALRIEILRQPRELAKLKADVLSMRQRMLDNHASHSEEFFDLKQDPGGLIDVEFIVQYLVLGHAHSHERLCGNLGNIALLGIAAELGLIPQSLADPVRNTYREFRRLQHAFRLNGISSARVERAAHARRIEAVKALWATVFD